MLLTITIKKQKQNTDHILVVLVPHVNVADEKGQAKQMSIQISCFNHYILRTIGRP